MSRLLLVPDETRITAGSNDRIQQGSCRAVFKTRAMHLSPRRHSLGFAVHGTSHAPALLRDTGRGHTTLYFV